MSPTNMKRFSILWIVLFLAMEAFGQVWVNTNVPGTIGPIPGASPVALIPNNSVLYQPGIVKFLSPVYLHDDWTISLNERIGNVISGSVDVACSGGYYFPDYFSLLPTIYGYGESTFGETSSYNSVNAQWVEFGQASGYLLDPDVVRQAAWSSDVEYSDPQNVDIVETNGQTVALWLDGIEVGATGRVTATLGEFIRTVDFTKPADGVSFSNRYWVSDLAGSLREHVNTSLLARASRTGASASVYATGAYAQTNFVRDTNCWAYGIDLTCASPWNSDWHMYKAGTAVTPQHFLYAAHFVAPTGTVFRWIDATNGIHDRTLVDQRILSSDIAIGRLDSPLESSIVPAKVIAENDVGRLRGAYGLRNCPGFRLLYLDQAERAWLAKSSFMENTTYSFLDIAGFHGDTNFPFSRLEAVAGDSGNPVFMAIGTNTVLFSTFHGPTLGPLFCGHQAEIEAAMSSMGASIYTNLPKIDLSTWTNYDFGADIPNM